MIEAGTYGPSLENQLKPHGLYVASTSRSSFELFERLEGWIATRSGGHFASFIHKSTICRKQLRESRRRWRGGDGRLRDPVPGLDDRMFLGLAKEIRSAYRAWMRFQPVQDFRAARIASFPLVLDAGRAVRDVAQEGLYPSNCRIREASRGLQHACGDRPVLPSW